MSSSGPNTPPNRTIAASHGISRRRNGASGAGTPNPWRPDAQSSGQGPPEIEQARKKLCIDLAKQQL